MLGKQWLSHPGQRLAAVNMQWDPQEMLKHFHAPLHWHASTE